MNAPAMSDLQRQLYARRVTVAREHLQQGALSLARELVPKGKRIGSSWQGLPPHRDSDNATAFAVFVSGARAGGWIDFVSGEKGDVFGLIRLVKGCTFHEALMWAEERFGLARMSDADRQRLAKDAEKRSKEIDQAEAEKHKRDVQRAGHLFSQATKEIEGTALDRYWLARKIDMRSLPFLERRWLRFHGAAPNWLDPARPTFPAQMAGFTDHQGTMRAIHVTLLAPDGSGKADVAKPKLIWPSYKGCVIQVNRGAGGMDPAAAAQAGHAAPLAITEGIEDALSIAMADPGLRVWAAGALANYLNLFDHPCVSDFIVARDNDWGKRQAAHLFERALARLKGFGKPVSVVAARVGKDFNDQL